MSTFAAEPWQATEPAEHSGLINVFAADGAPVAMVPPGYGYPDREATARLIAAAPGLLESNFQASAILAALAVALEAGYPFGPDTRATMLTDIRKIEALCDAADAKARGVS